MKKNPSGIKASSSYGDAEFGRNRNLEGNVGVQEVGVVQRVEGALVDGLQREIQGGNRFQASAATRRGSFQPAAQFTHITQIQEVIEEDEGHVLPANSLQGLNKKNLLFSTGSHIDPRKWERCLPTHGLIHDNKHR